MDCSISANGFNQFPIEIWGQFLNRLEVKDQHCSQLVCRVWQKKIEEAYGGLEKKQDHWASVLMPELDGIPKQIKDVFGGEYKIYMMPVVDLPDEGEYSEESFVIDALMESPHMLMRAKLQDSAAIIMKLFCFGPISCPIPVIIGGKGDSAVISSQSHYSAFKEVFPGDNDQIIIEKKHLSTLETLLKDNFIAVEKKHVMLASKKAIKAFDPQVLHKIASGLINADINGLKFLCKTMDVNAADENGNTPLHFIIAQYGNAEKNTQWKLREVITELLEHGANRLETNKEGLTPIDLALKHQNTCKSLLKLLENS